MKTEAPKAKPGETERLKEATNRIHVIMKEYQLAGICLLANESGIGCINEVEIPEGVLKYSDEIGGIRIKSDAELPKGRTRLQCEKASETMLYGLMRQIDKLGERLCEATRFLAANSPALIGEIGKKLVRSIFGEGYSKN